MAEPLELELPLGRGDTESGVTQTNTRATLQELLRAVEGGGADALAVLLAKLDTKAGRAAVTRIAKLSLLTGAYTPLLVERLANGIKAASVSVDATEVPRWRDLGKQLTLPSTRRGIGVALALLRALGGEEF